MSADWPGGVRHAGDVSLVCCFHMEREKAFSDVVLVVDGLGLSRLQVWGSEGLADRFVVAVMFL